ncbi:MAG: zinc/iron-chelating domain-containing protein [Flavobacteriaceae bacterium]|nr:MAG: zinc/iron-chelating domain-containing protein [Flavobacteriaceae bacterium]
MISPEELPKLAKEHSKTHQRLLGDLKKKKPKDLDQTMLLLHQEVFEQTDCLSCGSCCRTTGPLFTTKDIERISKKLKLKPGEFVSSYLKIDQEGDYVLQKLPCPFLDLSDNFCSIYQDRPKACREFPHTDRRDFQNISTLTLENVKICPAAFGVVQKLALVYEKNKK